MVAYPNRASTTRSRGTGRTCVALCMTGEGNALRRVAESRLAVPAPLHEYQWEGVYFLYQSSGALLADEMGLGKTVQTAVAISLLLDATNDVGRVLIVTPASLTLNWMMELSMWAPEVAARRLEGSASDRSALYMLPYLYWWGSYEQLRVDGLDRVPRNAFDLVVLDEAQRIKDRNSATSLACRLLPRSRRGRCRRHLWKTDWTTSPRSWDS